MGYLSVKYTDWSGERSSVNVPILDGALEVDRQALEDALAGMTVGTQGQATFRVETIDTPDDASLPANQFAQRETKWLVSARDNTLGLPVTFEIPTADATLLASGSDMADMTNANVIAFVGAVEALAESRYGNAYTVETIRLVGRNL